MSDGETQETRDELGQSAAWTAFRMYATATDREIISHIDPTTMIDMIADLLMVLHTVTPDVSIQGTSEQALALAVNRLWPEGERNGPRQK